MKASQQIDGLLSWNTFFRGLAHHLSLSYWVTYVCTLEGAECLVHIPHFQFFGGFVEQWFCSYFFHLTFFLLAKPFFLSFNGSNLQAKRFDDIGVLRSFQIFDIIVFDNLLQSFEFCLGELWHLLLLIGIVC